MKQESDRICIDLYAEEPQELFRDFERNPLTYDFNFLKADPERCFYLLPDIVNEKALLPEDKYDLWMFGFCNYESGSILELDRRHGYMEIVQLYPIGSGAREPVLTEACQFLSPGIRPENKLFRVDINSPLYEQLSQVKWQLHQLKKPGLLYDLLPDVIGGTSFNAVGKNVLLVGGCLTLHKGIDIEFRHQTGYLLCTHDLPVANSLRRTTLVKEQDCQFLGIQKELVKDIRVQKKLGKDQELSP